MPLVYRYITAALALIGCASLLTSGELNPAFVIPGLGMLPGYYRFIRGEPHAPWWAVGGLSVLALLVMGFEIAIVREDYFVAVAHMTISFQAIKSFDLKGPWDSLQVIFMALLQLIISSELSLSIVFGAVFVAFLVMLIVAIIFSHFVQEGTAGTVRFRRPAALVTAAVVALTLIFFVAAPRVRGGYFGAKHSKGIRSVGFSDRVDLGSYGSVLEDPTVVMRVELEGPRLPLYFRGGTLDRFDGAAWSDTVGGERPIFRRFGRRFTIRPGERPGAGRSDESAFTVQKITVEPMDTPALFALGSVREIEAPGYMIQMDDSGSVMFSAKSYRRISYTAFSLGDEGDAFAWRQQYLQLPEGIEFIAPIVERTVPSGTPLAEAARLIERHLREEYEYSLRTTAPPEGVTPLEHFLLGERKGYCEHFSTAMVVMLRRLGIPSRIVTGFYGGDENEIGDYVIVRQSNAHSWVEAAIDGRWVRFDPTPITPPALPTAFTLYFDSVRMAWYRYVIGYSQSDQTAMLRALSRPAWDLPGVSGLTRPAVILAVVVFMGVLGGWMLVRVRGTKGVRAYARHPASRYFLKVRGLIRRRGGEVDETSSSREVLEEARRVLGPGAGAEVEKFVRAYEEARFGGGTDGRGLKAVYGRLRKAARAARPGD